MMNTETTLRIAAASFVLASLLSFLLLWFLKARKASKNAARTIRRLGTLDGHGCIPWAIEPRRAIRGAVSLCKPFPVAVPPRRTAHFLPTLTEVAHLALFCPGAGHICFQDGTVCNICSVDNIRGYVE